MLSRNVDVNPRREVRALEEEKRISPMPPIRLSMSDVHGQGEDGILEYEDGSLLRQQLTSRHHERSHMQQIRHGLHQYFRK